MAFVILRQFLSSSTFLTFLIYYENVWYFVTVFWGGLLWFVYMNADARKKGITCPGAEVTGGCQPLCLGAGTELRSS